MAVTVLGLSVQEEWRGVRTDTSATATDDVEIAINTTLTAQQAVLLIDKIKEYVIANRVPS